MSRRFALRPPLGTSPLEIAATLRTWAAQLNDFVTVMGEEAQSVTSISSGVLDVASSSYFEIAPAAPTNITSISNGRTGQPVTLKLSANATLVHTAGVIELTGGVNRTGSTVLTLWLGSDGIWRDQPVNITAGSITTTHIADDSITTPKLVANAVTAAKILAGSIETDKLAAGAVTADKITVTTLSAITANVGTLTAGVLRDAANKFNIDLTNRSITIADEQASPVTRVRIGELAAGIEDWGIEVYDSAGAQILSADGLGVNVVGSTQIQNLAVTSDKIAAASISVAKFAAGLRPVEIVSSLGSAGTQGRTVFLTTDNKLYRDTGSAWVATVPTTDLTGQITTGQITDVAVTAAKIALGAVGSTQLADGSVSVAKHASGLRPVEIVSSLGSAGTQGRTVFLTTDNKLYRDTGSAWTAVVPTTDLTGTISSAQIADAAISVAKFAAGLRPVEVVSSLGSAGTQGRTVFLTTDNKLYRDTGSAWTAVVPTTDLTGQITTTQITDVAVTAAKIATGAVGNTQLADGSVSVAKHASGLRPVEIVSSLGSAGTQGRTVFLTTDNKLYRDTGSAWTAVVPTTDLTGTIATAQVADDAITAAKLTENSQGFNTDVVFSATDNNTVAWATGTIRFADGTASGTITASNTGNITALTYIYYDPAVSTTALQTTTTVATATGDRKRILCVAKNVADTNQLAFFVPVVGTFGINADQISANSITTGKIAALAVTADRIAANTITASQIAALTITANEIAASTITGGKIAAGTITAANIQAATITATEIAANTITAGQIAASAIATDELAANAVTAAKLSIQSHAINSLTFTNNSPSGGSVAWSAHTIQYNGTNYSISGSNSSNECIWFDRSAGTVQGSTRTSFESSYNPNDGDLLLAVNTGGTAEVIYNATLVTGGAIKTGVIVADKIAAATITGAKIAAGTITASNIQAGTITANEIAANTITAGQIAAGAVNTDELAANAVTAAKIAALTITAAEIAANTITGGKIAATTITAANIAANTITANEIAANTITAGQIASAAISTDELAASAVTAAKLSIQQHAINSLTFTNNSPSGGRVAWGAHTISWNGNTYSISASDTNAEVIWFDRSVSTTALQGSTRTAFEAAYNPADGDILLAVNSSGTAEVIFNATLVTGGAIKTGVIVADKIAAATITGAKIAATTITAANIAANTITANEIAANTITAGQIAAGAINTDELAANAVTAAKIAAGEITAEKISVGIMGGSNTLRNSSFEDGSTGWSIYDNDGGSSGGSSSIQTSGSYHGAKHWRTSWTGTNGSTKGVARGADVGWKANTTYVVSWYAKVATGIATGMNLYWNTTPSVQTALLNPNLTTSWQRYAYRLTWGGSVDTQLFISITNAFSTGANDLDIDGIQVEIGEVLSGYAPKPDEVLPGTISTTEIADNAITTGKINANAVTAAKIAASTITATELATDSISSAKIQAGAVTATKISVSTLSAIVADIGTITAGLLQNASSNPTAAIRLTSGYSLPGTATSYLDLAATSTNPFLQHGGIVLRANGTARLNSVDLGGSGSLTVDSGLLGNNSVLFANSGGRVALVYGENLDPDTYRAVELAALKADGSTWATVGRFVGASYVGSTQFDVPRAFLTCPDSIVGDYGLLNNSEVTFAYSGTTFWIYVKRSDGSMYRTSLSLSAAP